MQLKLGWYHTLMRTIDSVSVKAIADLQEGLDQCTRVRIRSGVAAIRAGRKSCHDGVPYGEERTHDVL